MRFLKFATPFEMIYYGQYNPTRLHVNPYEINDSCRLYSHSFTDYLGRTTSTFVGGILVPPGKPGFP